MPAVLSRVAAPAGARYAAQGGAGDDIDLESALADRKLRRLRAAIAVRRQKIKAVLAATTRTGHGPQGRKQREETFFSWKDHVRRMSEAQFKLRYRLDFDSFEELYKIVGADLAVADRKMAKLAKWGHLVDGRAKLAMGLRYLAGGSPLDLELIYHVTKNYVYKCVWKVVDAVNKHFTIEFPIDDVEKLKVLEAEWATKSRCKGWRGQVAAVDGVHFGMLAPTSDDCDDPSNYYVSRKNTYALLCMALCDADRRFLDYEIRQSPNTHDSLAFALSPLGMRVANGDLPRPFFINGDSAFALSNSMMTPSGGGTPQLDNFDFVQSSNRIAIECAFGILIKRWAILWKPLCMRFDRRAPLIGACMRLHNFCIDRRIQEETRDMGEGISEIQPSRYAKTPKFDREGRPVNYLKIIRGPKQSHRGIGLNSPHTLTRDKLVAAVRSSGVTRPALPTGIRKKQRKKGRRN